MRWRNIPILAVCQALGFAGPPMIVLVGGIVGEGLAPSPALATLPISVMLVGVVSTMIPAALLMKRLGRRLGFVSAALIGMSASLLGAYAVGAGNFILFCMAAFLIGSSTAFGQQYRFAAAESVPTQYAARAVSFVLVGGIAAGYLGPEIATRAHYIFQDHAYSGAFLILAGLYAVVAVLLIFLKDILPVEEEAVGEDRPLRRIISQPVFLGAVLSAAVAYGVMSLIMTATPLHLHRGHGFSLEETAWVIKSHIIAMYLPSLFTGLLLERLGVLRVMALGILGLFTCVILAFISSELVHYWWALVLLGVGWNFLFVGATVLLTGVYHTRERFKVQASNDFLVFGTQAFTSLSAGTLLYYANWDILNIMALPFLALTLAVVLLLRRQLVEQAV
jgi:MFS family permease